MFEGLIKIDFTNPTFLLIITGIIVVPLSGILNNMYNKSQKTKLVKKQNPSEDKPNIVTSDKTPKVSMDNFETKEDQPMGDKTHD
jgi:hypothetical protein